MICVYINQSLNMNMSQSISSSSSFKRILLHLFVFVFVCIRGGVLTNANMSIYVHDHPSTTRKQQCNTLELQHLDFRGDYQMYICTDTCVLRFLQPIFCMPFSSWPKETTFRILKYTPRNNK